MYTGGGYLDKAAVAAIVAGLLTFGGVAYSPVLAADKDIVDKGAQPIAYDISPVNDGTNIAIGKDAKVFIGGGTQESMLSFGETVHKGFLSMHIHDNNHAKQNLPEAIAVGTNSYARTGAIEIGAHTLAENQIAIGDTTADKLRQFGVASTTLGTNSYTGGGFATTIGSYNVQTNQYEAAGLSDAGNATKNAFATVIGTFNSNESMTGSSSSGVANMISGTANKVTNSNGAIVMGAGNSVKDSIASFDTSAYSSLFKSATDMQKALMEGVAKSAGGATLVIGGGNSAEKTQNSQIMGVGNSMKSTTYKKVQYNYLDGFNSSITDASHVKVLGQGVTINKGADSNTVIGDYRTVAEGQTHNVIIGNADEKTPITTEKKDTVILGHNANATVDGGVALGDGSVASVDKASVDKNAIGYDPATKKPSTVDSSTWKSTAAAVSVGDASKNMTRQITNLAAGAQDTDAVNVAQLKAAQTHFYSVNSTDEKAVNYNNDGAKGKNSLAAGVGALANGSNSVAIGTNAKAQNDALAVGESASAGNNSIAIGMHASAGYSQNMALGYYANVANEVTNSTALGYGSQVTKRDILKSDDNEGVISVGKSVGQSGEKGMTRRIINVKAGVNDTDAVNVSQLTKQAQAATTEVMAGTNIASVTKNDKTADGHTIYTVNAKGTTVSGDGNFNITPKADDATNVTDYAISLKNTITIGSGTGTHPITINGTDGVINGLTNTTWDKKADYSQSTKAATEAQLQQAMNDAQKAAEANDTDTHVKAGEYAVDTNHQVSMDIVDKEGKSTGNKITITDVAKASDVGDVSKLATSSPTVVDAINNVNTKVDNVDEKVGNLQYGTEGQTNVVTNGDSVTKAIGDLDKAIGNVSTEAGRHTIVSTTDPNLSVKNIAEKGEAANYQISMNKDLNVNSLTAADKIKTKELEVADSATIGKVTINKDNKGTIGGLTNKTWDAKNITSGQAATEDQLKAATKNAVNYDGDDSKTITLRENTTIKNVADTTIEQGSKNIVNAGTVYNETRVAKDGKFVKQSNTAGENLSALDNQVTANTESIYYMNGRISDLDNRVNKVGAGAAALAALHPLDFDPDDKWDFAVGYGNYRNANSVAFGAFYRPNEDTMFSLGTNFGNGENMFNAGLSFKIGQGGSGITTSKTAMAKKIESLENTVDQQDKKIAELEALVKEQGEMIRQYVGKK